MGEAMRGSRLLALDGVGNILLGLPLLLFPETVSHFLGLPPMESRFFPLILGAVFVGIGAALLLQRFKPELGGLGLAGAISINLIFGIVLGGWLLFSDVRLPARGMFVLLALTVILVGISVIETLSVIGTDAPDGPVQADGRPAVNDDSPNP